MDEYDVEFASMMIAQAEDTRPVKAFILLGPIGTGFAGMQLFIMALGIRTWMPFWAALPIFLICSNGLIFALRRRNKYWHAVRVFTACYLQYLNERRDLT